jgi:hypothetical protein
MRVEATWVRLRPRPMSEAADLGVRLVQASAGSLWRTVLPVYALAMVLALSLWPIAPWAPSLALWWAKPWLDRSLLFVLSRALFHQPTRFADLWAARGPVLWQGLLGTLTTRRLSQWRAFTQPAVQLEGLRGAALRKRCAQLRRGHQGAALWASAGFGMVETALVAGLPGLLLWLAPGGISTAPMDWLTGRDDLMASLGFTLVYMLVVAMVEPFYVGAGFAMYVNRRVELEAWDVEQSLRHAFAPA